MTGKFDVVVSIDMDDYLRTFKPGPNVTHLQKQWIKAKLKREFYKKLDEAFADDENSSTATTP